MSTANDVPHIPVLLDEVIAALGDADLLVAPSVVASNGKREGIPVVLMEALACKVPVVAPSVAGIPELVVHNETGLLFTPSDWNGWPRTVCCPRKPTRP